MTPAVQVMIDVRLGQAGMTSTGKLPF